MIQQFKPQHKTSTERLSTCIALILVSLSGPVAASEKEVNEFAVKGELRAGWLEYDYSNPNGDPSINKGHKDSEGFYIIPKLSVLTPKVKGFSGKITVAGATDFGINDPDKASRLFVYDPVENEDFIILQELFVEFNSAQLSRLYILYDLVWLRSGD